MVAAGRYSQASSEDPSMAGKETFCLVNPLVSSGPDKSVCRQLLQPAAMLSKEQILCQSVENAEPHVATYLVST